MKTIVIAAVAVWFLFGVAASGFYRTALYFGGQYCFITTHQDERTDQVASIVFIPWGPLYFAVALAASGFGSTGWSLAPSLCPRGSYRFPERSLNDVN